MNGTLASALRPAEPEQGNLDVTPFMNLMIVLVPVLLLSMTFTQVGGIGFSTAPSPAAEALEGAGASAPAAEAVQPVQVLVGADAAVVIAPQRPNAVVRTTAAGALDLAALRAALIAAKQATPDGRAVVVRLTDAASYQQLVAVLEHVRSGPGSALTSVATSVQLPAGTPGTGAAAASEFELFPEITLGTVTDQEMSSLLGTKS